MTGGAAVALIVVLSLCICCAVAPVPAATFMERPDCCESECAAAVTAPTAAVLTVKRSDDRPVAVVHTLTPSVIANSDAVGVLATVTRGSRLFAPLTSIQLRI